MKLLKYDLLFKCFDNVSATAAVFFEAKSD